MVTLEIAIFRISIGTPSVISLKECCDSWNKSHSTLWYEKEPHIIAGDRHSWLNFWTAGAAEYAASIIGKEPPEWSLDPKRFSHTPILLTGLPNSKKYALIDTPFSFRKRMLFCGRTTLR